jgi:hypothetical protein
MKTYGGMYVYIVYTLIYLGTSWKWVVSFTSLPLYPREKRWIYQFYKVG